MNLDQLDDNACFRQAGDLEINQVPDGAMVYQKARERVHFLNTTALVVFELCDTSRSRVEIENFVTQAFGLAAAPQQEIADCLTSLLDEGLVEAGPCPPSSAAR
jgi:hypothetical protein